MGDCLSLRLHCSTNLTHSRWFSRCMQVIELNPLPTKSTLQHETIQVRANKTNKNKMRMVNTVVSKIFGSILGALWLSSLQVYCWMQGAILWTHLSGMCVTSSSALSVCKSLLDAPTSPSCIFLKCIEYERNVMHCVNGRYVILWSGMTTNNSLDFKLAHKSLHAKENQET